MLEVDQRRLPGSTGGEFGSTQTVLRVILAAGEVPWGFPSPVKLELFTDAAFVGLVTAADLVGSLVLAKLGGPVLLLWLVAVPLVFLSLVVGCTLLVAPCLLALGLLVFSMALAAPPIWPFADQVFPGLVAVTVASSFLDAFCVRGAACFVVVVELLLVGSVLADWWGSGVLPGAFSGLLFQGLGLLASCC